MPTMTITVPLLTSFLLSAFLSVLAAENEKAFGFLDLYKPEDIDTESLYLENPSFLGQECGPASYVALRKIHEKFKDEKFGTNLELLTSIDIDKTAWDRENTMRPLDARIECGDEWKSSRCLERLKESDRSPLLIIGSHKDLASQTSAVYSYINQALYAYVTLKFDDSAVIDGGLKTNKGWENTVRMITDSPKILSSFLGHFNWKKHLTLITQVFEVHYTATNLFKDMNLLGHSHLIQTDLYPFSFLEEANNTIDELKTTAYDDEPSYYEVYGNFSNIYFKGDSIKNSSRSKIFVVM